ncbi:hypothetical protein ACFE04_018831 [Oxalis oulophora]
MSMITRVSRAGFWMLKQLSTTGGQCASMCRHVNKAFNQCHRPLFDSRTPIDVLQGSMFQKYHRFSTAAATNSASEDETPETEQMISVMFVGKDGEEQQIKVPIGTSMLEAAHYNDIELEGACEGSLACSTCHLIVKDMEYYNKLEDPADEENDMLDLAFGVTETSRLGCQIIASSELDGIRLKLPSATRNFAVDGFSPKPH